MSSVAKITATYEEILAISNRMLSLAKTDNWDELIEAEATQQAIVRNLRARLEAGHAPFPAETDARINDITLQILSLDTEIRRLVEKRLGDLRQIFHSAEISKRLNNAYKSP